MGGWEIGTLESVKFICCTSVMGSIHGFMFCTCDRCCLVVGVDGVEARRGMGHLKQSNLPEPTVHSVL